MGHASAQLDALQLTEAVRERLVSFSVDSRFSRDSNLTEICGRIWRGQPEKGGLLSELWVEGAFPAELSDASLASLVAEGQFDSELRHVLDKSGAMPANRTLYTHQKEAIHSARRRGPNDERPALVVTAGTGAGKTECFLLPILDNLYRNPAGAGGMKCLILYPMNALVNDQVESIDFTVGWKIKLRSRCFTSRARLLRTNRRQTTTVCLAGNLVECALGKKRADWKRAKERKPMAVRFRIL
jgi:hypothetical protein